MGIKGRHTWDRRVEPPPSGARLARAHLDTIRAAVGSDRRIAGILGVSPSQITRWRGGQAPDAGNADRLGGLALGSSEYTFAIVVSVFVLCIAVGSLAVALFPRLPPRALLFDLADRRPPVVERVDSPSTPESGALVFEGVTVRFPGADRPTLDGIDAEISDGAFVAVVGPSGSGKSTLVELLARFRDPDEGRVLLGGTDLQDLSPSTRRARVAFVPQRPDVFFGTIGDNLRLARTDATDDELRAVLDRAALGDWVRSLQHGLETTTGELGETMSGGQRQRLTIARAFLRDADVLILDEATSELDMVTERLVLDQVKRQRGERTVVVVAHRLESVVDADEILVIDGGRLVARGSHSALTSGDSVYSGLWRRHTDFLSETA